jgi:hypothetical protein
MLIRRFRRAVARSCYVLLAAAAAGLGLAPPPRPFRHEDSIAQVVEGEEGATKP